MFVIACRLFGVGYKGLEGWYIVMKWMWMSYIMVEKEVLVYHLLIGRARELADDLNTRIAMLVGS